MSEEEKQVTTETEETEETTTSEQTEESSKETGKGKDLEDYLKDELSKSEEKDKEPSDAEKEKSKEVKEDAKKGKVKLSASERVQQAVNAKKEAEEKVNQLTSEVTNLKNEITSIKKMLETGELSKTEAKKSVKEAEDAFKAILDGIEVPEELEPYKAEIAKIAKTLMDETIKPFKERFELEDKEREERNIKEFQSSMHQSYSSVAKDYPHLFMKPEKEGDLPELKPEFDEEALEIIDEFNIPMEEGIFNPILASEKGLRMLMQYLNRRVESAEKAKRDNEKIEKLRRSTVETSESGSGKTKTTPRPLESYLREELSKI